MTREMAELRLRILLKDYRNDLELYKNALLHVQLQREELFVKRIMQFFDDVQNGRSDSQ